MTARRGTRVGIALGGGAARGLAHLGVIRALVRAGVPIDIVVGTSMGSVIGGAFAATGDIDHLDSQIRAYLDSEAFRKLRLSFLRETKKQRGGLLYSVSNLVRRGIVYGTSTLRGSFLSAERFARSLEAVLPDVDIESLPVPFAAVALDIARAEEVVLARGSLRQAAEASSAIPGVLPPVTVDGRTLVDGGWIDKVPVLPVHRLGADIVIAVDITADIHDTDDFSRGIDVMLRATAIKDTVLVRMHCHFADVVIAPAVKHVHWADFGSVEEVVAEGERATEAAIPRIRELLKGRRWPWRRRASLAKRMASLYFSMEGQRPRSLGTTTIEETERS